MLQAGRWLGNGDLHLRPTAHLAWRNPKNTSREETPDLFFEWSREQATFMVQEWFMSPQVAIEGYISNGPIFQEILPCSSLAPAPKPPRELLDSMEIAFRLWPDFNGMSILTRKVSSDGLLRILDNDDLRRAITASVGQEKGFS